MRQRVADSRNASGKLLVLTAVLFLSLTQPLLILGQNQGAELVVHEADGRLAAENEIRRVEFTPGGMRFVVKAGSDSDSPGRFEFRFKTAVVGGSVWVAEGTHGTEPVRQINEVFYARSGSLHETYRATERGVEQLIVLNHDFLGTAGDLEITGEVETTLLEQSPVRALGALTFYSEHGPALNFGPVLATDASGRQSEVEIRLEGTRLTLVVNATWLKGATYPLAIQSSIQTLAMPQTPSRKASGESVRLAVPETTGTKPAPLISIEDTPVWRAQLRFFTANVSGAGTDDRIQVHLNSNNSTWLYSSFRDDFEAGESYGYDLTLDNVKKLRDITNLEISKTGFDDWGIKSFTLYVNGKAVYSIDFGGVRWLNRYGVDTHVVWSSDLRNHSFWRSYVPPAPPQYISGAELINRIEGITGDFIVNTGSALRFSPSVNPSVNAVLVSGNGTRTIRVDMDLKYRKVYTSIFPWENRVVDFEVDVEFDLEFSCSGGKIFLQSRNLDMAYPVVDNASQTDRSMLQVLVLTVVPLDIQRDLQHVTYTNGLGQPACPPIRVVGNSVYLY